MILRGRVRLAEQSGSLVDQNGKGHGYDGLVELDRALAHHRSSTRGSTARSAKSRDACAGSGSTDDG
jgi:hypothetical protein